MKSLRFVPYFLTLVTLMFAVQQAVAQQLIRVPLVQYTVPSLGLDGIAPITETFSFGVKVSGPGTTQLDRPVTVTINVTLLNAPEGVTTEEALSFVTLNTSILTVDKTDEYFYFVGTYAVPEGMLPGDYEYEISTTGWEAGYDRFTTYVDEKTYLNVTLIPPPPMVGPPVVTISSPASQQRFTYTLGGPPVMVPVSFTAVANPLVPLTALSATISGQPVNSLVINGVGTGEATGSASVPFSQGGTYTLNAVGFNTVGSDFDSLDFYVDVKIPPPTISISTPLNGAQFEMLLGGPGLTIPYQFVVDSMEGGIGSVSASLGGPPLTVSASGLGTLQATGSGDMLITQPGNYTLSATGTRSTDGISVSSSVSFTVVGITPPPTVTIHTPADGAEFARLAGDPPTVIDYTFTASAAASPIDQVVVRVNGVIVTPTTLNGLNTNTATGSGSVSASGPKDFTVTVTAFSAGQQADDAVSFQVVEGVMTPPTVTILTPEEGAVFNRNLGDPDTSVPYTFVANATFGVIDTLTVYIGGEVVTPAEVIGLGTATVTGAGTYLTSTAGNRSLTVTASGPAGSASDAVNFSVVEHIAPPTVEFTSPENGLVVERMVGEEPVPVPYSFLAMAEIGIIDAVTLTLNGETITPTLQGLNTPDVIGTGTVTLSNAGSHVLTVTAFSNGLQATDTLTLQSVINEPPPSACGQVLWLTPFSHGRTIQCGSTMAFRFRLICEGKNVIDPEVVVVIFEKFADGTISEPEIFPWGSVPHSGTYKYTGNHYHLNYQTAATGNRVYRIEVYRPVTPGSTTMALLDARELRTKCDGKSGKSGKSDKSSKSGKSDKSDKSGKSDKSDKSSKSGKSDKSDKSDKSSKSGKSDKSDKSGKSDKSDKSSKSGKSDKSDKSSKSSGKGNPGNDKPVGNAGENPNGKAGWGSGSKGMSDGDKSKGNSSKSGSSKSDKSSKGNSSKPSGKGNPGNDKPVGNAGEQPNGKAGWGSGSKGMSDGDKSKGNSSKSGSSKGGKKPKG